MLVTSRHFVLERADLDPDSSWMTETDPETWILVIDGNGQIGSAETAVGDAIFMEADSAVMKAGPHGMSVLIASSGAEPIASLLWGCTARVNGAAHTSSVPPSAESDEIIEVLT